MLQKVRTLVHKKSFRNSLWIISERIFQALVSFILTILTSRYLGPANFGVLDYGATIVSFFAVITKLGIDNILVNELLKHRNIEGAILGTSAILRLASSFLSILLIIILVLVLENDSPLIIVTTVFQAFSLIFQALAVPESWFQSRLESKYVSIAKAISYSIVSSYKAFLLITNKDVTWFAVSNVIDFALIAGVELVLYKKKNGPRLSFDKKWAKRIIDQSRHFIISGLLVLIYTQIDKIMIGSMLGSRSLGLYSAALKLCTIWSFVPEAIISSAKTIIFSLKQSKNNYLIRLKQTYFIVFWGCSFVAAIITLCGPLLINVVFGEDYSDAVTTLQILVWFMPLSQLGAARNIWLISENLSRYAKRFAAYGVVVNIGMNAILIPIMGINGAALATVITEVVTCFIAPLFYKETRKGASLICSSLCLNLK